MCVTRREPLAKGQPGPRSPSPLERVCSRGGIGLGPPNTHCSLRQAYSPVRPTPAATSERGTIPSMQFAGRARGRVWLQSSQASTHGRETAGLGARGTGARKEGQGPQTQSVRHGGGQLCAIVGGWVWATPQKVPVCTSWCHLVTKQADPQLALGPGMT